MTPAGTGSLRENLWRRGWAPLLGPAAVFNSPGITKAAWSDFWTVCGRKSGNRGFKLPTDNGPSIRWSRFIAPCFPVTPPGSKVGDRADNLFSRRSAHRSSLRVPRRSLVRSRIWMTYKGHGPIPMDPTAGSFGSAWTLHSRKRHFLDPFGSSMLGLPNEKVVLRDRAFFIRIVPSRPGPKRGNQRGGYPQGADRRPTGGLGRDLRGFRGRCLRH